MSWSQVKIDVTRGVCSKLEGEKQIKIWVQQKHSLLYHA